MPAMLPPELLTQIFEQCATPELARLVLSCRHFNKIAMPILYRSIDLGMGETQPKVAQLESLTWLMLQRPDLAKCVEHFSCRKDWGLIPPHRDAPIARSLSLEPVLLAAVNGLATTERDLVQWTIDLDPESSFSVDALLCILFPQLVNMRSLDMCPPLHPRYTIERMFANPRYLSPAPESRFPCLKAAMFDLQGSRQFGSITPFIALPTLRELYVCNLSPEGGSSRDDAFTRVLQPSSCSTKVIHIRHSRLNVHTMKHLLHAPEALETFCFELGPENEWDITPIMPTVVRHLPSQKETLENLSLGYGLDCLEDHDSVLLPPTFCAQFPNLRRLKLVTDFIFPRTPGNVQDCLLNWLPPILQDLTIQTGARRMQSWPIDSVLERLVFLLSQPPPSLKTLTLAMTKPDIHELRPRLQVLVRLGRAAGVDVSFLARNSGPYTADDMHERGWSFDEDVWWRECADGNRGPVWESVDI